MRSRMAGRSRNASRMGWRRFLRLTVGAVALLTTAQACGKSDDDVTPRTIKIGIVSPLTGPGAEFGDVDTFVVEQVRQHFEREGITVAGKKYDVQILLRDNPRSDAGPDLESVSPADLMSEAALDLIRRDGVDLILASSGGETTIGVSNVCEANGMPCISTVVPWETWFIARGGKPGQTSFTWTYHFFWGSMDPISVYLDMWSQLSTNKVVGGLWPDDLQGIAVADPTSGYPAVLHWTNGPVKNVAKTGLVGGQWQKGTNHPFELVIVSNKDHPDIPREGSMQPMP